jgi:hypothetical protein
MAVSKDNGLIFNRQFINYHINVALEQTDRINKYEDNCNGCYVT